MNQPKAMQFQLYAASLLSMLTPCLVLGDPTSPTYMAAEAALKQAFNFRSSFCLLWRQDNP
jgi:hypothetical protein